MSYQVGLGFAAPTSAKARDELSAAAAALGFRCVLGVEQFWDELHIGLRGLAEAEGFAEHWLLEADSGAHGISEQFNELVRNGIEPPLFAALREAAETSV